MFSSQHRSRNNSAVAAQVANYYEADALVVSTRFFFSGCISFDFWSSCVLMVSMLLFGDGEDYLSQGSLTNE